MLRRGEDRHLLKAIWAFLSRRSSQFGKSPCYTTTLNSGFAVGTLFWLKANTREHELISRIPHAQTTLRRVPINFRRTERAAPALPQFVGEPCDFFVRGANTLRRRPLWSNSGFSVDVALRILGQATVSNTVVLYGPTVSQIVVHDH